jgi:hypothetical protein
MAAPVQTETKAEMSGASEEQNKEALLDVVKMTGHATCAFSEASVLMFALVTTASRRGSAASKV